MFNLLRLIGDAHGDLTRASQKTGIKMPTLHGLVREGKGLKGLHHLDTVAKHYGIDVSALLTAPGTLPVTAEGPPHDKARADLESSRAEALTVFTEEVQRVTKSLIDAHAEAINVVLAVVGETALPAPKRKAHGRRHRGGADKSPPGRKKA